MLIFAIIGMVLIIISIFILKYAINKISQTHKYNQEIDNKNQELQKDYQYNLNEYNNLISSIEIQKERLNDINNNISNVIDNQKELSQKAYENYCEILEKQYEEYEEEYNRYKDVLETSYSNKQLELMQEMNEVQKDLDKIKATRTAALQAQLKEKEIKEQLSFYCLSITETELDDIKILNKMKAQLHNPRILSMLIWSTYFQKSMSALCNNIIGATVKSGIYKITNQLDDMCYIGQAVDLARRWKDHVKCGLGIDTPSSNKLYKAMQEDGVWNFSFEILEECPREELNEKERYYIQLYESCDFGYNSNSGIK